MKVNLNIKFEKTAEIDFFIESIIELNRLFFDFAGIDNRHWFEPKYTQSLKGIGFNNCCNDRFSKFLGLLPFIDETLTLWFYSEPMITCDDYEILYNKLKSIRSFKNLTITIE